MSRRGDKTLILMLSKLLGSVLCFGGGLVIARYLTTNEYATFSQVMLIASTFAIIPAAFQQSLYYFIPLAVPQQWKKVIFSGFIGGLIFICIANSAMLPFRKQLADLLNNPALLPLMPMIIIFLFCFCLSGYIDPVLICLEEEVKLAIIRGLSFILAFVAICVSIIMHLELSILIVYLAVAHSILPVYTVYRSARLNREVSIISSVSWEEIRKQFSYAFPLFLSALFGVIGRRLDQYLISACFDTHDYAIYARGAIQLPFAEIVTMSIFTILIPEFVKLYNQSNVQKILFLWKEGVRRAALIFFPFAAFFILKAEPLMILLFSEKYADSAPIFQVYAIQLIVGIALYGAIPRSAGNTRVIYHATIIFGLSNLAISYPLILAIGPIGAAVGTAISGILSSFYYLVIIKRILKCKFRHVFPFKDLFKNALISIFAAVVVFAAVPCGYAHLPNVLCSFLLFAIIIPLCYFYFGLLTTDDKAYLNSTFTRFYNKFSPM